MHRTAFALAAILFVVATASAQPETPQPAAKQIEIAVSDEMNVRIVCDAARGSGQISLETASQVIGYCLGLLGRLRNAAAAPSTEQRK